MHGEKTHSRSKLQQMKSTQSILTIISTKKWGEEIDEGKTRLTERLTQNNGEGRERMRDTEGITQNNKEGQERMKLTEIGGRTARQPASQDRSAEPSVMLTQPLPAQGLRSTGWSVFGHFFVLAI